MHRSSSGCTQQHVSQRDLYIIRKFSITVDDNEDKNSQLARPTKQQCCSNGQAAPGLDALASWGTHSRQVTNPNYIRHQEGIHAMNSDVLPLEHPADNGCNSTVVVEKLHRSGSSQGDLVSHRETEAGGKVVPSAMSIRSCESNGWQQCVGGLQERPQVPVLASCCQAGKGIAAAGQSRVGGNKERDVAEVVVREDPWELTRECHYVKALDIKGPE